MDIQKYEDVLRQLCTKQLGEIRAVYFTKEAKPIGDSPELRSLGQAFQQLGSILEYGTDLIKALDLMNIELTEAQFSEMLQVQSDTIEHGQLMSCNVYSVDVCRDHVEQYLIDHGLFGR